MNESQTRLEKITQMPKIRIVRYNFFNFCRLKNIDMEEKKKEEIGYTVCSQLSEIELTVHQLESNLSEYSKELIINFINSEYSVKEMQLFTNCSPKSKQLFIKKYITPSMELGL